MNKTFACILIVYVLSIVVFSTWQLFRGNLEAAFATLPFLFVTYLFIKRYKT